MTHFDGTRYDAAWDKSTWFVLILVACCCIAIFFFDDGIWPAVISLGILLFVVLCFKGIYYKIDGNQLIVYTFFIPKAYPIAEIKEVKPSDSTYASPAPALSKRLAITFTNPDILKSPLPLLISPVRQQEFIRELHDINPNIQVGSGSASYIINDL
ncbi:MAG: PH domain-containing protein [Muribaculaceae bacterium]|nr:PH domain-containing protein [Muribaculaceae bacterium]